MTDEARTAISMAMKFLGHLTVAAGLLLPAALAPAQPSYPAPGRIITIVVPFSLGTGPDILARLAGQKLGERWGASVIVDNRPGASGNIGAELVAKAPGDGYTLMMTATSFALNAALNKSAPYDPLKSFAPVSLVATGALAFAVSTDTPAKTLKEFVALAKARPGELNYASSGNGTPQHLTMELFKLAAGVNITHVPYKDSAAATRDLAGGHVDAMIFPVNTAAPLVRAGKARSLAVFGNERSPVFPDAPTMKEEGFTSVEAHVWYALFAPAATPPETVQKLNDEMNSILDFADVKELLSRQGLVPAGGKPEKLTQMVKSELERWTRVIAEAKITRD
ncbi:MAG TPA: tripartite tricarboxylate transporter substrate binding protein [Burkholderiales bacterium]|nr:tripartite tricarboxylate transporter substrate binding protein [Burkholderiales bacterium]